MNTKWMSKGNCADTNPDAFFPSDGVGVEIAKSICNKCQHVVYVPTTGCMNLAATVNVLLYDRLAKSGATQYGDQIIVASRDTNNRTKV